MAVNEGRARPMRVDVESLGRAEARMPFDLRRMEQFLKERRDGCASGLLNELTCPPCYAAVAGYLHRGTR